MTATNEATLRYIDSDGHILEPPTGMLDFAPAGYRDRIWHIEEDPDGTEWSCGTGFAGSQAGWPAPLGFPTRWSSGCGPARSPTARPVRRVGPRTSA